MKELAESKLEAFQEMASGHRGTVYDIGNGRVLKMFMPGADPEDVVFEFEVSKGANQSGVATPRPFEIVRVNEQLGIVFEKIEGPTLAQFVLSRPWRVFWASEKAAQLHAQINSLKLAGATTIHQDLAEKIRCVREISEHQRGNALKELSQLPEGEMLCHHDMHPGNILVSDGKLYVIDWGGAKCGTPYADVAHTYVLNKVDGIIEDTPHYIKLLIKLLRNSYLKRYLRAYAEAANTPFSVLRKNLDDWLFVTANARLASYGDFETQSLINLISDIEKCPRKFGR